MSMRPLSGSAPNYRLLDCVCMCVCARLLVGRGGGALGARNLEVFALEEFHEGLFDETCCGSCTSPEISTHISTRKIEYFCSIKTSDECCWKSGGFLEAVDCGPGEISRKTPLETAYPCCDACEDLHSFDYHSTSKKEYFYSRQFGECCWWNDCSCPQSSQRDDNSTGSLEELEHVNSPAGVHPCLMKSGELMSIKSCAVSRKGGEHMLNQDNYAHACKEAVCMVAAFDGHGEGSEAASKTAAELFLRYFSERLPPGESTLSFGEQFVKDMVHEVAQHFKEDKQYDSMGCTATGFFVDLDTAVVIAFNIGDSRTLVWKTSSDETAKDHELMIGTVDHISSSSDHIEHLFCVWYQQNGTSQELPPELVSQIESTCSPRIGSEARELGSVPQSEVDESTTIDRLGSDAPELDSATQSKVDESAMIDRIGSDAPELDSATQSKVDEPNMIDRIGSDAPELDSATQSKVDESTMIDQIGSDAPELDSGTHSKVDESTMTDRIESDAPELDNATQSRVDESTMTDQIGSDAPELDSATQSKVDESTMIDYLKAAEFIEEDEVKRDDTSFLRMYTKGQTRRMRPSRTLGDNDYGERIRHTPDIVLRDLACYPHPLYSFVVGSDGVFDTFRQERESPKSSFLHDADSVNNAVIEYIDSYFRNYVVKYEHDWNKRRFVLANMLVRLSQWSRLKDPRYIKEDDTTAVVGFLERKAEA
eukprot:TRINITY_DN5407_c0_g1_i1.p1 TRINITY_DN5407_c0_g1~~TRINITY_DN5407_c0_g1_i1.p1  ORF type:complete len:708 (-),score=83.42 TRINITY_DN5407_c0_g1_i1:110-2233(-)